MSPPQSSEMLRKDSATSNDERQIPQNAAAKAQFVPSSKSNTVLNPFGSEFTPGKGFSVANDKERDNASSSSSSLYTPAKGSAMKLLNIGSTPDGPSTKSSSVSPVKPIGSGFSSPSRQPLLKDGPAFSTDTDPNVAETRFVRFGLIPTDWLQEGTLQEVLEGTELTELIESCVYAADDTPGCFALYCRFDDLRAAAVSKARFERALTTVSFAFVDHHEYFGHDHDNPRAQAVSAYDGQVEITATPKSMMEFNINSIFAEVREFAEAFGNVRSFAYIETKGFQAPRFRAEFFSVKSAESAVAVSNQNDSSCFSDSLTVSVKEYAPPGYMRYVHPAASMVQLVDATQGLAVSGETDDEYSHYTTRRSRGDYPGNSRGNSGPRRGRGGFRNSVPRGLQPAWWIPSEDSPVHQTDMEYWRFNQPQTVNLRKIEAGVDVRTTVMLRNIPNRVDFEDLKLFLDATSEGHYDFSYLRIDFSNNLNVGYAFVNFVRPEFIINFVQQRVGKEWSMYGSLKKCEVSYATIQGIDCLLAKFRNSVVMEEIPRYRPKLWYHVDSTDLPTIAGHPDNEAIGTEAPFPPPNNEQKRKRSRDNAGTIGLFPPRRGRGPYGPGSHFREGQYDRGTSFAIEEERQHEEQRQLRFNERRLIGYRGNDRGQRPGGLRNGRNQQSRYRDEYDEEEDDYFDEDDPYFRGNRRPYYRR
ncbi:hypothetical protein KCU65_g1688, partial [Aureobasidium melanogenum]